MLLPSIGPYNGDCSLYFGLGTGNGGNVVFWEEEGQLSGGSFPGITGMDGIHGGIGPIERSQARGCHGDERQPI